MTSEKQTITGKVTRLGYYRDTLPKLVITIPKSAADGLSICEGERENLQLSMNGKTYHAGIRTTSKARVLTICPDLQDIAGGEIRLTDLLLRHNIEQKATVSLSLSAEGVTITM